MNQLLSYHLVRTLRSLLIICMASALGHCSPDPAAESTLRSGSYSKCTNSGDNKCNTTQKSANSNSSNDEFDSFDPNNVVPSYRQENILGNFNQRDPTKEVIDPADAGKIFQVLRVPYYRIMWMNLSKKTWTDTVHSWVNNNVATPLANAGATASLPYSAASDPDQISIFQPMPPLTVAAMEQGGFRVLGYAAHNKLAMPSFPTAVVAAMPGQAGTIWAQPDDYELIYSQGVPGYPELYEMCFTQQAQIDMSIKTSLQETCAGYLPEIFGNFSNINYNSYSIDGSGNPTRWKHWFDVITMAIWRPIPPDGYKCLGYAASNGEIDKPQVEIFDPNNPQAGPRVQSDHAGIYCIKDEYVVEGVIGNRIARTSDKGVSFYEIRAKDPKIGYDLSHFFYARANPSLPSQKDEKVWVLRTDIIKLHPDDRLLSK